ncbi:MAG: WbuC family cupin fold metalloprotein [Rhodospirillaceae bacterium]|nr:WbuC family cupin fold metalloprotein [Rhodospirillales bacterium]
MKVVDAMQLERMSDLAREVPRRRTHFNLHDELTDPVQRVVIALEPGTYVRPHRHGDGVWELFVVLEGACAVLIFDDEGSVIQRVQLIPGGARLAQVPVGAWHSVVALAPGTIAFEVKPGPYVPATDKNFAAWAPQEGEPGTSAMVRWLENAAVGERFS